MMHDTSVVGVTQSDEEDVVIATHDHPDTDAWACAWAVSRFLLSEKQRERVCITFVRAGESLPEDEFPGRRVIHVDTGKGDYDQHGKIFCRTSSFALMAKKHGFDKDPGLQHILELTVATDNVEEVDPTSVHYYFKSLPGLYRDPETKVIDWHAVQGRVFEVLDALYSLHSLIAKARREFEKRGKIIQIGSVKLALILWAGNLREAAYDQGADVVLWTNRAKEFGRDKFYVGFQVARKSQVTLERLAAHLRRVEARVRNVRVPDDVDLSSVGDDPLGSKWYLHESRRLIVNGSRGHPLEHEDEFTRLSTNEIVECAKTILGRSVRRK